MATSGTVSTTVFNTRKVIDHAFRRCKLSPQQITPEYIETAQDLLFLFLSTLASKGIALWAIDKVILPLYAYQQTVPCPVGTVDVLNANLRTSTRVTNETLFTSSEGFAEYAFDGDIDTECVQTLPAGWIQSQLDSVTAAPLFGILPGSSGLWDVSIQASQDGITWTTLYTNDALIALDGEWHWIDIQGVIPYLYYRLQANNLTVLNVREFYVGNLPNEIEIAKVNRDDYANLPNKFFTGRPVQFWYNKQRDQPLMEIWPAPMEQYTFAQLVLYTQRYVQDVGSMTQELEVPQRWYKPIMLQLGKDLAGEIAEVQPGVANEIAMELMPVLREAWDSETDSAPSYILPNISCYTR